MKIPVQELLVNEGGEHIFEGGVFSSDYGIKDFASLHNFV